MRHFAAFTLLLLPVVASAQAGPPDDPRYLVVGGVGADSVWDDEGPLGNGVGLSVGAGVRLTPRVAIVGLVDRVGYYRNTDWLTFDGRTVFTGAEIGVQFTRPGAGPYVTVGAGMLNDDGIWIRKFQARPQGPIVEERIDRTGSAAAMTASAGYAWRLSPRLSLRGGVRVHGALRPEHDVFPHVVIQPAASIVARF